MLERRRHAEIAGAGLAGLATAAALAHRGWTVRVHERGAELREIGAGIYLYENALRALRVLGVCDEVLANAEEITHATLHDHRNRVVELDDRERPPRLVVSLRRALHAALARAATDAGVEIVVNSHVLGAFTDGRLELANGVAVEADLVVGADGVYSKVRDSLALASRILELGDGCGRHLIDRDKTDPANSAFEIWNGGRRLGIAPASSEKVYLFLCCAASDIAGRLQQPFAIEPWLASHPWYRGQLRRIPRHPEGRWLPFYDVTCRAWSAGHVALVGDAAHAMAPNLGQGACVALTNAVALAAAVSAGQDVSAALRRWEANERPMVDATQRNSRWYGVIGTKWPENPRLLDLRSSALSAIARIPAFQTSMRSAIDHPVLDGVLPRVVASR